MGITQKASDDDVLENTLTAIAGFLTDPFDYCAVTYPAGDTEVYTYKTGGSGGVTVATITVVYTDSTKLNLSTITKV